MNAMQTQLNQRKTTTWNGAVAYETSGSAMLDFNFAISSLRNEPDEKIQREFSRVFYENKVRAMKFLFYVRDCREGIGERRIFRVCMDWLDDMHPKYAKAVLPLIPEYGRWDDLWPLLSSSVGGDILLLVDRQLSQDREDMRNGKPISLLGKWMCSENSSSPATKAIGAKLRNGLGLSPRTYRKTLSSLRKYLDVVECKMSSGQWGKIKYETVPSKANLNYKDAFMKHDAERRSEYLESLKKGETKINASVLQPHEIVNRYVSNSWCTDVKPFDASLEELWKALPDVTVGDTLVVRDGSGSMLSGYGPAIPLDVATALAIYMSEHNHGCWKDRFITFSGAPKIVSLANCETLREKLDVSYREADCSNTDIARTMRLILATAVNNGCTQDDMPRTILIISDMGFDSIGRRSDKSLFEDLAFEYAQKGYKLPRLIFWNVAARPGNGIPLQENELGVIMVSGFSVQIAKMMMSGKTDPFEALIETINAPRYDAVEQAVTGV